MDRDLARRSHAVLARAVDIDEPERRRAFVDEACASDPLLHRKVIELLKAIDRSGTFLESPALGARHAALHAPASLPEQIGRYRVVRVIGVGGMATVYEAIQDQPSRRVALKVMRRGLTHTSALLRFRFETEVLARLQHPGIAQIFEAGACDDGHGVSTPYFAMEFIADALPITAYADQHALPLHDRLTMFATVCDAVHHGHQLGVIHRDLKPGNILVAGDGRAKVIDFGVARSSDPAGHSITQNTERGQLIGTLNSMSPEQCAGNAAIDIRTDIYSLGVVLYQLVCGSLPHDLADLPLPEALRVVLQESPRRPGAVNPAAQGDLDAIIMKALEKDPERRYQSAAALATDLRRFLGHQTIEARPPTVFRQCRLFARRHRPLVSAALAALLVVCAAGVFSTAFAYRAVRESGRRMEAEARAIADRDAARRHEYTAMIAGAFAALQANEFQQLRDRLARAPEKFRGWEWGYLRGMAERSEQTIAAHSDMVYAFAASADATRLATGCRDGSIRVWDVADGRQRAGILANPDTPVLSVAFSPDASRLVAGSDDGSLRIWDVATEQPVRSLGTHADRVQSVSWSPHAVIASASDDGVARLWDAASGQMLELLDDQPGGVHGVAFSADGTWLLTWSRAGSLWLRSAVGLDVCMRLEFDGEIQHAVISSDNSLIAAGGSSGRVTLWRADTGQTIHDLVTPYSVSTIRSLAFSPRADRLAAGQIHRGIVLWSVATGKQLGQLRGHEEAVSGLWFTPDDRKLFSVSWDRSIRVWGVDPVAPTSLITTLEGHNNLVLAAAFSPDASFVATGGADKAVRIWEPELGLEIDALRRHEKTVYSVAFSPDGRLLASGSHDHTVRLWNTATGVEEAVLDDHSDAVWTVAFSPDSRLLASAGDDASIILWDVAARKSLRALNGHGHRVINIAFSPDGATLASSSRDKTVRIWDVATGRRLHLLADHESDVFAVVFSHDGRRLYSGSRDQTVRVWDTTTGERLDVLAGHGQFVTCLAISPDSTRLAAGSWFGEIVLWDLSTNAIVASFKGHDHAIRAITFSPDGRRLASASYDRTVRIFDAAPPAERRAARRKAQQSHDQARAILDRLSENEPNPERVVALIDADISIDEDVRHWARNLLRSTRPGAHH